MYERSLYLSEKKDDATTKNGLSTFVCVCVRVGEDEKM